MVKFRVRLEGLSQSLWRELEVSMTMRRKLGKRVQFRQRRK